MDNRISIVKIVIVSVIILLSASLLFDSIGRAWRYTTEAETTVNRENMQICLSKNVSFQECYRAIFDSYSFKNN